MTAWTPLIACSLVMLLIMVAQRWDGRPVMADSAVGPHFLALPLIRFSVSQYLNMWILVLFSSCDTDNVCLLMF